MADKTLQLTLDFDVKGEEVIAKVDKLVDNLVTDLNKAASMAGLDEVLDSVKAAKEVTALDKAVQDLYAALRKANVPLDLHVEKGKQQVDALAVSLKRIVDLASSIGKTPIDFDVTAASKDVDFLVTKGKQVIDLLAQMGTTKVDFDVTLAAKDLDLLLAKGKQVVDMVTKADDTPIDFDTSKANVDLDLLAQKGKQVADVLLKMGRTPVNINLGKIEQEAQRAASALQRLQTQQEKQRQQTLKNEEANRKHASSIREQVQQILFFRRALLGLGVVALGQQVLQLVQAFDKARAAINAVFRDGDPAAEFEFIRIQAERLGISVTELADQYAKFAHGSVLPIPTPPVEPLMATLAGATARKFDFR